MYVCIYIYMFIHTYIQCIKKDHYRNICKTAQTPPKMLQIISKRRMPASEQRRPARSAAVG